MSDTDMIGLRPSDELGGQVAIVTGAARNIGRSIARSLAAGGAAVMVNAVTSIDAAHETVRMIEDAGGRATSFVADVSEYAAVEAMVAETVNVLGPPTILVNNHTYRHTMPFEKLEIADWQKMIDIVLTGVFYTSRAVIPHMIEAGKGSIVNISGLGAHSGYAGGMSRSAAKSGVEGMSRAAALDLAPYGITVNCVAPGAIATERDQRVWHGTTPPPAKPAVRTDIPAGREGYPAEIAAMVRTLCGPDSRFITGQTIHVNGGQLRT